MTDDSVYLFVPILGLALMILGTSFDMDGLVTTGFGLCFGSALLGLYFSLFG